MWLFLATVGNVVCILDFCLHRYRPKGNWLYFELPALFYITTGIILVSSVTMQLAFFAAKKDNIIRVKA